MKYGFRLSALLLGRLRMKPAEAIEAYLDLDTAIATSPTNDQEERRGNMERFIKVISKLLGDCGLQEGTLLMTDETMKATCKTCVP
jgi:hypothetical protein